MNENCSDAPTHSTPGGPLRVFISSTMEELRHVRIVVRDTLRRMHIHAYIWEADEGAGPRTVVTTSLKEVGGSDMLVAIFSSAYGEVTAAEFRHARSLGKPCFVYIENRHRQRDERLERFLQDEVRDLTCGVTYAYFDNVLELGAQVARGIMRFLVDVYRKGTRQVTPGAIGPAVRLAWDVADWYRAFGHELVEEPHPVCSRAMDLKVAVKLNVPGMGPAFQRFKIRCVGDSAVSSDAAGLAEQIAVSPTEIGVLVSAVEITPAAREQARNCERVTLLTFDELLDQTVRFDDYLNWLEGEVKRLGIDTGYIPLGCRSDESGVYPGQEGGIDRYVDRWLDERPKEHLSILGQFGTGKTWFVYHLASLRAAEYRQARDRRARRPRIPIVVSLRDFAKAVSIESLFSDFFFRRHNIGIPNYEAFKQLNRMGKVLLLFDGFDEMAARVDRQKMVNNFWELARALVPGGKVILTCRTEHFPEAKEGRALLNAQLRASTAALTGEPPQFETVELEQFTDEQIRQVLLSRARGEDIVEKVLGNPDLKDLARRPLMLEYILEALPDLELGGPVGMARVYLCALSRKMDLEIEREGRTFLSLADKLYFLCEISWEMLATDQMALNYRDFPSRLRRLFGHVLDTQRDLDHWEHAMRANTMLIRNAEGDYFPAHRSLLEFFAAFKFVAELGVLADEFTSLPRQQSFLDMDAPPQPYTWSSYFRRDVDAKGHVKAIPPLKAFCTEARGKSGRQLRTDGPDALLSEGGALVNIEKLPRAALMFAGGMVATDPESLARLCELAWDETGDLAWSAQTLLPFLKYEHGERAARVLVEKAGGRPLRGGVTWVLGELGVADGEVVRALRDTIRGFSQEKGISASAWWEAAFALEKLGELGLRKGRQGDEAAKLLIASLPARLTLRDALENLRRAFRATTQTEARISQADVVVVLKHEQQINTRDVFVDTLALADFNVDTLGRRTYYAVWLCGHLAIRESLPYVLRATRHPLSSVRNCAAEALGKIGVLTPEVIEALELLLQDGYYRTRYHAAWSLGELRVVGCVEKLIEAIKVEELRDVKEKMIEVRDRLRACLAPDELQRWFENVRNVLETAYVSHSEPWRQSGMSGPEERWIALRKPVADCMDRPGSFLDIGCANGYLIQCCLKWTAERGIQIVPYGLDLSARLVEMAKQRLPQFADHFFVGNGFEWMPPAKFDYVRTELVYVPAEYEKEYLAFLLKHHLKPDGRLLVPNYAEDHPNPEVGILPGSHPTRYILERLAELGFSPIAHKDGYDPVKGRKVRVAILINQDRL